MRFTKGDRVRLVSMFDDPDPITPGSEGVVVHTAELNFRDEPPQEHVSVVWDNGRRLACLIPPDVLVRADPTQP